MACPSCGNMVSYWKTDGTGVQMGYRVVCASCGTEMPKYSPTSPYINPGPALPVTQTNIVYTPPYEGDFELYARVECDECGYYESEGTCNFSAGKITYKCLKCDKITELADLNPTFNVTYTTTNYTAEPVDE